MFVCLFSCVQRNVCMYVCIVCVWYIHVRMYVYIVCVWCMYVSSLFCATRCVYVCIFSTTTVRLQSVDIDTSPKQKKKSKEKTCEKGLCVRANSPGVALDMIILMKGSFVLTLFEILKVNFFIFF